MIQLVTYDFHNTIAHCDDWFQLEIRTLPVRVLERANSGHLNRIGEETLTAKYRELRQQVMADGIEIEAIEGLTLTYQAFDLDLDLEQFEYDLTSAEVSARVRDDMLDAEAMDITAVPTFYVNGARLVGPHDAQTLIRQLRATDPRGR